MIEVGQVFGRWTVVGIPNPTRPASILAHCACGTERVLTATTLTRGVSKGCRACADFSNNGGQRRRAVVNEGDRFGSWTIVREVERPARGARMMLARCECGDEHVQTLGNLRAGASTRCRKCSSSVASRTHGRSKSSLYGLWSGMVSRCHNPNATHFDLYGGRGITVCPEWRTFAGFAAYIDGTLGARPSPGHSIDRIDNERGYEPGNVRWATHREQARNRRTTTLRALDDDALTLQEIADRVGLSREAIRLRLLSGWTVEECATHRRGEVPARLARAPGRQSDGRRRGCSACGQPGHYARTCGRPAKPVREPRPVRVKPAPVVREDGRRGYRCGCCGEQGHQARTCARRLDSAA